MANFPAAGYVSNAGRTEGEQKTAFEDWLAATKQLPGGAGLTVLTIASGVVTPTGAYHGIDTESGGAFDDLTNIAQTNLPEGSIITLALVSNTRVVTLKHGAGGAGQMIFPGAQDVVLRDTAQRITLQRGGTVWQEVSRSGYILAQARPYFEYASATSCVLQPGALPLWAGNTWTLRFTGDSPLTLGTGGLAANTFYYVYAEISGNLIVLVPSTAAPTIVDGVLVATGAVTRTLVGALLTNGSTQFVNDGQFAQVVSHFSRRRRSVVRTPGGTLTTTSTTAVSMTAGIGFIRWFDAHATVGVQATVKNSGVNGLSRTSIAASLAVVASLAGTSATADAWVPVHVSARIAGVTQWVFVEGKMHVGSGTGSWQDTSEYAEFEG